MRKLYFTKLSVLFCRVYYAFYKAFYEMKIAFWKIYMDHTSVILNK